MQRNANTKSIQVRNVKRRCGAIMPSLLFAKIDLTYTSSILLSGASCDTGMLSECKNFEMVDSSRLTLTPHSKVVGLHDGHIKCKVHKKRLGKGF